jgi:predicted MFS family arabinose efflux permease
MTDFGDGTVGAGRASRWLLSDRATFCLYASISLCCLAGSSAPTPLYPLYQAAWHFSPIALTLIFGIYALFVLASLLVFGRISDHLGRRPVVAVSLLVQCAAMYLLASATGTTDLAVARSLQGMATGGAIAAIGAALIDLDRVKGAVANTIAPISGTAVGALVSGISVHFLPQPTRLTYAILGCIFLMQSAGMFFARESVLPAVGALRSMIPSFAIPPQVKPALLRCAPVLVAVWALVGLYGSLGPALIKHVFDADASFAGGFALFVFTASGSVGVLWLRSLAARQLVAVGASAIMIGTIALIVSLQTAGGTLFGVATIVSGVGFGVGFQGGIKLVMPLAHAHERAGVLSAVFACCYLGMSLPAFTAGCIIANGSDLVRTAQAFGVVVIMAGGAALLGLMSYRHPL